MVGWVRNLCLLPWCLITCYILSQHQITTLHHAYEIVSHMSRLKNFRNFHKISHTTWHALRIIVVWLQCCVCASVGLKTFFVFDWLNSECRVVCSNELNDLIDFEWVLSLEKRLQARFTVPIFVEMNWRWKWCRRTISVIVPIFYRKSIMLRYRKRWPLIQLQWRCVCVCVFMLIMCAMCIVSQMS